MKQYKIFGFDNKPFNYFIIVTANSVDEVFNKCRTIYGYFSAVQPL
jgi:hypothetical protein